MDKESTIIIEVTRLIEELIAVICNNDVFKPINKNNNDMDKDEKNIKDTSLIDQTHSTVINNDHQNKEEEEVRIIFY